MLSDREWTLITRYIAGDIPPNDRDDVERWIQEDPARMRVEKDLASIWTSRGPQADAKSAWSRIANELEAESRPPAPKRPVIGMWRRSTLLRAAAIAGLLVAGAVGGKAWFEHSNRAEVELEATELRTAPGEIRRIGLDDGSELVLAPATHLRVLSDFGESSRTVELVTGEAFFKVVEDASRPFIVRTSDAVAQALGTEFDVIARTSGVSEVIVVSGRVGVRSSQNRAAGEAIVGPGESALVRTGQERVTVTRVDPAPRLAWIEGRLVFQNMPLGQVVEQLELWFEVDLRVADSTLAERPLNGSLERPSLQEALHAISLAADATYEVEGRQVTFTRKER